MDNLEQFIFLMAALSTAAQSVTEHVTKLIPWFGTKVQGKPEQVRQAGIHLSCAIVGALLVASTGKDPLLLIANTNSICTNPWLEYPIVGILVSYGSGFFNDLLGVLQSFKAAQQAVTTAAAQASAAFPDTSSTLVAVRPDDQDHFDVSYFDDESTPAVDAGGKG